MAKTITRAALTLFGESGAGTNFAQFGSQAAGTPLKTKSITSIQALAAWVNGWQDAVALGQAPYLEDMNGAMYVSFYEMCYMLQEGIPEWDTDTTYFIGGIVKKPGTALVYRSLVDDNVGQALPNDGESDANWAFVSLQSSQLNVLDFGATNDASTDSTAAIQAAINIAFNMGNNVYLPAGRYKITETLTMPFNYSPSSYPGNEVIGNGLLGDGPNSTFIEWWSPLLLQNVRKAMLYLQGFSRVENLCFICPRRYQDFTPSGLGDSNTPYYGIVGNNTFWKSSIKNVHVRFAHVPFSVGCIKKYKIAGNGLEFEPTSGGSSLSIDPAQFIVENCRFTAWTYEFADGTLNPLSQLNANGTNLLQGVAKSTPLDSAVFSDGSYALEIGGQQAVNINFISCTVEQVNVNSGAHPVAGPATIRLNQAGFVEFNDCLIGSPPSNDAEYTYAFLEYVTSGGSNTVLDKCYLIGGVLTGNSSQGTMRIKNCNGENTIASGQSYNNGVKLFAGLAGVLGYFIEIDGFDIGRGDVAARIIEIDASVQQSTTAVSPFANGILPNERPRYRFKNITGVTNYVIGGQSLTTPSRFETQVSLMPDLPAILRGKAIPIDYLPPAFYNPANARTAMTLYSQHDGKWMYKLTNSVDNYIEPLIRIDSDVAYNLAIDVYIKMVGGHTVSELVNDMYVRISWYDAGGSSVQQQSPVLFGAGGDTNYDALKDGMVVTAKLYNVVPPSTAAFMSFQMGGNPVATRVTEISIGNARAWVAGNDECVPLVFTPGLYISAAVPSTGTWSVGDRTANSTPASGQPKGWICTVAGTPGTWISEGNL